MEDIRKKTYKGSDIASVSALQTACRFDETTNVELTLMTAKRDDDNKRVTFVAYKDNDNVPGKLIFVEYQDNHDYIEKMNQQTGQMNSHLFDGTAYIGERIAKVMVFRTSNS